MPSWRHASASSLTTSRPKGECMMLKSVSFVSNMQKPSWCFVVNTMYFMPAASPAPPTRGVELRRVELLVEVVVFLDRHLGAARPADLGALEAHRSPVDEHAEPRVTPPGEPFGIGRRFLRCRRLIVSPAQPPPSRLRSITLRRSLQATTCRSRVPCMMPSRYRSVLQVYAPVLRSKSSLRVMLADRAAAASFRDDRWAASIAPFSHLPNQRASLSPLLKIPNAPCSFRVD